MKYVVLALSLMASFLFLTTAAQAARPCKPIVEACMSAGVIHRGASKQTMIENCVRPIVSGRGIRGVNVDPAVVKACREKLASR